MTLDEARNASAAYYYYSSVLSSIVSLGGSEESVEVVEVGLGERGLYGYPRTSLRIPRDLVNRMLEHALARAKSSLDALGDAP